MHDAMITFVYVRDLDRADAFYGGALGLELVTIQAVCRIYRASPSGYLGVCVNDRPVTPEGLILTLVRDDVDEFCAQLAARGVELEKPPTDNARFGIRQAFVRDPDGHLVEIQRFDDPAWAEPIRD